MVWSKLKVIVSVDSELMLVVCSVNWFQSNLLSQSMLVLLWVCKSSIEMRADRQVTEFSRGLRAFSSSSRLENPQIQGSKKRRGGKKRDGRERWHRRVDRQAHFTKASVYVSRIIRRWKGLHMIILYAGNKSEAWIVVSLNQAMGHWKEMSYKVF